MIWLHEHFYYFIIWLFIIGCVIGSFLNVIIYRLPIMLKNQWHKQCEDFLEIPSSKKKPPISKLTINDELQDKKVNGISRKSYLFNLAWPNSHCIYCKKNLKPYHNIPIVSYIFLRGRCAYCNTAISWQYPIVELFTATISLIAAFHFGLSYECLAFLLLTYALIVLTVIDLKHQLLPDTITLSFIWLGLLLNIFNLFSSLSDAVIGAVLGYLSLWSVNYLFKIIMKKEGMGHGDFKLFAVFGAWFGWQLLPLILFLSAAVGSIIGISLIFMKKITRDHPIPFGPYLAIAGWIVALFGQQLYTFFI